MTIAETGREQLAIWYAAADGHQRGPWKLDQLLAQFGNGTLSLDSLIWVSGMTGWLPARDVEEVRDAALRARVIPPPLPASGSKSQEGPPPLPASRNFAAPAPGSSEPTIDSGPSSCAPGPIRSPAMGEHGASEFLTAFPDLTARPWRRWFARTIDYALASLAIGVIIGLVSPTSDIHNYSDAVIGLLVVLLFIPVEAMFISCYAATPGKAILSIAVVQAETGERLRFVQSLERAVDVWVRGVGLGLPLVTLFTALHQHKLLTRDGATSYDKASGCVSRSGPLGLGRLIVTVLVVLAIGVIMVALSG